MFINFFRNTAGAVRSINRKYAAPSMKMTWAVRISLGFLRGYLLLVALMIYKFIVTVRG